MARRVSVSESSSKSALTGQTFRVTCTCGETVSGQRQIQHQEVPCPACGKRLFVLPADCYAGAAPLRPRRDPVPAEGTASGGVIDKLNRLAFWTRLREGRTNLGGQLCAVVSRAGQWLKTRFSAFRS